MLIYFYNILGMILLIWYSCLRWFVEGNNLGELVITDLKVTIFKLNWIWALINLATAFSSIWILAKSVLFLDDTFTKNIATVVFLLIIRNVWYTLEDVKQFNNMPVFNFKQFMYIVIDIAMLIECLVWWYLFKKQ